MPPRAHVAKSRELVYKPVGRVVGRGSFKIVPATSRQAQSSAALPAASVVHPPPVVDPPILDNNDEMNFEGPCEAIEAVPKKSGKVSEPKINQTGGPF